MRELFVTMCSPAGKRAAAPHNKGSCAQNGTTLVYAITAGQPASAFRSVPLSYHTARVVLSGLARLRLPNAPTLVLHNFNGVHLLHLHPELPWYDAHAAVADNPRSGGLSGECFPSKSCPDLRANLELEERMQTDVMAYRERLGAGAAIVFYTPHYICPHRPGYVHNWWRFFATLPAVGVAGRLADCKSYVLRRAAGAEQPLPKLDADAHVFCEASLATSCGTQWIANRMKAAAAQLSVAVLDGYALSRCNETHDGIHYTGLLETVAQLFSELVRDKAVPGALKS